jgi:hypothetical protein
MDGSEKQFTCYSIRVREMHPHHHYSEFTAIVFTGCKSPVACKPSKNIIWPVGTFGTQSCGAPIQK